MRKSYLLFLCLFLASCQMAPSFHKWEGRWTGPEGTYLDLKQDGTSYKIAIQDLDSVHLFTGRDESGGISFIRNGQQELLHAGNGDDTGMKWLSGKKDCLVIRKGEGFCRD